MIELFRNYENHINHNQSIKNIFYWLLYSTWFESKYSNILYWITWKLRKPNAIMETPSPGKICTHHAISLQVARHHQMRSLFVWLPQTPTTHTHTHTHEHSRFTQRSSFSVHYCQPARILDVVKPSWAELRMVMRKAHRECTKCAFLAGIVIFPFYFIYFFLLFFSSHSTSRNVI